MKSILWQAWTCCNFLWTSFELQWGILPKSCQQSKTQKNKRAKCDSCVQTPLNFRDSNILFVFVFFNAYTPKQLHSNLVFGDLSIELVDYFHGRCGMFFTLIFLWSYWKKKYFWTFQLNHEIFDKILSQSNKFPWWTKFVNCDAYHRSNIFISDGVVETTFASIEATAQFRTITFIRRWSAKSYQSKACVNVFGVAVYWENRLQAYCVRFCESEIFDFILLLMKVYFYWIA